MEWDIWMFVKAFVIGGALCIIGQLLIDLTKLTPARILVGFVVLGVLLTAVGAYGPLVEFAGAGATVPLSGFGYTLATGVREAVAEHGWLGALSGGLIATATGVSGAIFLGFLCALIAKPGDKS